MARSDHNDRSSRVGRLQAVARGHTAEGWAVFSLRLKGYRILSRRFRTRVGEIDIIARRGHLIAFIEVKQRPTRDLCEAAITGETRARVRRAADAWLARNETYHTCAIRFDLVFVVPGQWPIHLPGAL